MARTTAVTRINSAVRTSASTRTAVNTALYTTDVCNGGTASASSTFATQTAVKAFDNTALTDDYWLGNNALPAWLKYDFGAGVTKVIQKYTLQRQGTWLNAARMPKNFTFQGSNDDSAWTTLDTQTNQLWDDIAEVREFTFNNSVPYRYYRFYITANNLDNYAGVGEAQMMQKFRLPS